MPNETNYYKVFKTDDYDEVLIVCVGNDDASAIRFFFKINDRVIEMIKVYEGDTHEMDAWTAYAEINECNLVEACDKMYLSYLGQMQEDIEYKNIH